MNNKRKTTKNQVKSSASTFSPLSNEAVEQIITNLHEKLRAWTWRDLETHGKIATVFDSRREYARYLQLVYMQEAGKIRNLDQQKTLLIQEPFVYDGQKIKAITYNADFFYEENGREVVEDVKALDAKTGKSRMTEVFKLKWKILKHNYPQYDFRIF